jgi:hypothetical protein
MAEARRRKLQQFSCDPFSLRPSGLGERSYSLQNLQLTDPASPSPTLHDSFSSFKSNDLPSSSAGCKPTLSRSHYRSTEDLHHLDVTLDLSKKPSALSDFLPKEVLDTALQPNSVRSHARTKSLGYWEPSNVALRPLISPKRQEQSVVHRDELELTTSVIPKHGRLKSNICSLFKWNDSRGEVKRNCLQLSARERKSAENLSSVFGSPKASQSSKLFKPVLSKQPSAAAQSKTQEPPRLPRNVKPAKLTLRNCVPLTPRQMRDVMLRSPVVPYTPSKLLTLDLNGLSSSDDDFTIKQAVQGFHVVSVQTSNDQIKGTCQGSARIQLRVHDDPGSIKNLDLKLREKGWGFKEPGSLGRRSQREETTSTILSPNVMRGLHKHSASQPTRPLPVRTGKRCYVKENSPYTVLQPTKTSSVRVRQSE